ncbi:MAG: glycosyl transferase family 2 [Candidatus Angelobacter sp.]|jgi:GT2 family glycosyltransferase|nr:glycosyl transferase family 2 [Candidatus Angelobacter sp.]
MTLESASTGLTCSVVVCTRDRLEQLEKCLAGISGQTLKPVEVIVVDNAPENGSAEEIARRWGARYVFESRLGASSARNRGAREAIGDVIAYIDDDGLAQIDWVKNIVAAFRDTELVAVGGRTVAPQGDPETVSLCRMIQGGGEGRKAIILDKTGSYWFEMAAFGGICASGTNMAFRRSAFTKWTGFDLRLGPPHSGCEDLFAFLQLVDAGFQAAYVPDAVVTHPSVCSVEGLRERYLLNCAHATAYILFLLIHFPQQRGRLLKFISEGIRGVRREWRQEPNAVVFEHGIPAVKIHWARLRGGWLYIRALIASKA